MDKIWKHLCVGAIITTAHHSIGSKDTNEESKKKESQGNIIWKKNCTKESPYYVVFEATGAVKIRESSNGKYTTFVYSDGRFLIERNW